MRLVTTSKPKIFQNKQAATHRHHLATFGKEKLVFGQVSKLRNWPPFMGVERGLTQNYNSTPVDTGRKLNVHKTFRRSPGRLLNVLCTFNLRPVSIGTAHET